MAITREKKGELIADYKEKLAHSSAIILTNYRGLTVSDMESLRARVREVDGSYSIVKNTLTIRALQAASLPVPEGMLKGPTAIGFAFGDVPPLAKVLNDFAKDTQILEIKGGVMEGTLLTSEQVRSLATLPPREVILAQLLGLIQQPGNGVASVVNAAGSKLAAAIKAYADKLQEAGAAA